MSWAIVVIVGLILYIGLLACVIWLERRRPVDLAAWISIAMVFPYIGFACYLLFGQDFIRGRLQAKVLSMEDETNRAHAHSHSHSHETKDEGMEEEAAELLKQLENLSPYPITNGNKIKVLKDGHAAFAAMLECMEKAVQHIHLDFYTIRDDGVGREFQRLMQQKARAGIQVRVVYDGLGSHELSDSYVIELRAAGVDIIPFLPVRRAMLERRLNYRNHRKILVIDGAVGFLGGINIGDEYIGGDERLGYWRDTHLQLEGEAVLELQRFWAWDWRFASGEEIGLPMNSALMNRYAEGNKVLFVPSAPGRTKRYILDVVFRMITAAKHQVYVTTPYFIPDPGLLMALRTAARSGLDVRLLIPGIADTELVLLATLSNVQELLDDGVRVYRYAKGFIHAKVIIIDNTASSVGTANMDMRSFNNNFELNAIMFDQSTIAELKRQFHQDLKDSEELDRSRFAARPKSHKAKESMAAFLSPLL